MVARAKALTLVLPLMMSVWSILPVEGRGRTWKDVEGWRRAWKGGGRA